MAGWQKQTPTEPLWPVLLWSRPESRLTAGRILVVGGDSHQLAASLRAYETIATLGLAERRLLLPESLQKLVPPVPDVVFAPSTPTGSYSQEAEPALSSAAHWAQCAVVAVDTGHNSATTLLFERVLSKLPINWVIDAETLPSLAGRGQLVNLPNLHFVTTLSGLQKLMKAHPVEFAITSSQGLAQQVETLSQLSRQWHCSLSLVDEGNVITAQSGQVVSTRYQTTTTDLALAIGSMLAEAGAADMIFERLASAPLLLATKETP